MCARVYFFQTLLGRVGLSPKWQLVRLARLREQSSGLDGTRALHRLRVNLTFNLPLHSHHRHRCNLMIPLRLFLCQVSRNRLSMEVKVTRMKFGL